MSLRNPRRLTLTRLEDRVTPAVSAFLSSGLLTIRGDNAANSVVVAETATPGKFQVTNNGGFVGQFVFSNLNVTMGNGNDTVDLQIKTAITGNIFMSLGNGSDVVTTAASTLGSKIGGSVNIQLGNGNKLGAMTRLPPPNNSYDQGVILNNVVVGSGVTVSGPTGFTSGTALVSLRNSKVGGTLQAINVSAVSLGTFLALPEAVSVGAVVVSNSGLNTDSRTDQPAGLGNSLFFFNNVTVLNSVTVTGGSGNDRAELPGDPATATPSMIGGSVSFNAGGGTSTLSLGNGVNDGASAQVGGSVSYTGGEGQDRFFLDTGATVNGDVIVNLGEGDNTFFGDGFNPIFDATVGGDLRLTAGNGNNFVGSFVGGDTLSVGGDVRFQFGNGTNTGSGGGGAITFFNTGLSVGGEARYQAGTGTNSLDITNETIAELVLIFSGGPTTVNFNQASGFFNGSVYIDFGTGFGPKSLGGTAAFGGPVTIVNYP